MLPKYKNPPSPSKSSLGTAVLDLGGRTRTPTLQTAAICVRTVIAFATVIRLCHTTQRSELGGWVAFGVGWVPFWVLLHPPLTRPDK